MDQIAGAITGNFEKWRNEGLPVEMAQTTTPSQLKEHLDQYQVIDVREVSEFEDDGHIPGAIHCFVGSLGEQIDNHSINKPIVVTCSVGHRASVAASVLLKKGYKDVTNLLGGMTAWQKLKLPMKTKEADKSLYYKNQDAKPEFLENQLQH